jgi:hypothetical protein
MITAILPLTAAALLQLYKLYIHPRLGAGTPGSGVETQEASSLHKN